jgi:Retroviral aspartyl protease
LINTRYFSYSFISSSFANRNKFQYIKINPRDIIRFEKDPENQITKIIYISVDINSYYKEILYLYIVFRLANYNIILRKPWIKKQDVCINAKKETITTKLIGIIINNKDSIKTNKIILLEIIQISTTSFNLLAERNKKRKYKIFTTSITDIQKVLAIKKLILGRSS